MYKALVLFDAPVINNKHIWKMRVPFKIKIFTWYLLRGVVVTRDNLVKRNWQGSTKCCLCRHDENINDLFYQCKFACFLRRKYIGSKVSNMYQPSIVANIFDNSLHDIDHRDRKHLLSGGVALP